MFDKEYCFVKRFMKWKPSKVILAAFFVVALIAALIPLFALTKYMIPWFDDYGIVKYNRTFRAEYGDTLFNALRGVFFNIKEQWWAWSGTFSSIFLMTICPIAWGDQYYSIGGVLLIALFLASSLWMMMTLTRKMFGLGKAASVSVSFLSVFLFIEKMYHPGHGFFWYNGAVHYIGITSFLMLLVAIIVSFSETDGIPATVAEIVLGMICALVVSGGNLVTLLIGALAVAGLWVYTAFKFKKRSLRLIPITIVYAIGFYFNVTAPGNAKRAVNFEGLGMKPLDAVAGSFPEGLHKAIEFSDIFLVVVLLALIPIIWDGLKESKNRFRFPLIFVAFVLGMYFATFTPSLYSMGAVTVERVLNVCKLMFQLSLVLSEIYIIGWLKKCAVKNKWKMNLDIGYWWYFVILFCLLIVFHFAGSRSRLEYSSWEAFKELKGNEASAQYEEYLDRIEKIKTEKGDVVVSPYVNKAGYLRQYELSEDPNDKENVFMAEYYGVSSITLGK